MKHLFSLLLLVVLLPSVLTAEIKKETYTYAVKDGNELQLDIYKSQSDTLSPCLVFVFGGGFKEGSRDHESYQSYYRFFADNGFVVASIDYRLGLKDEKAPSALNTAPLRKAISLAVEDLYVATDYLLKHSEKLRIDTSKVIISGSSAGAITVLQADYEHCNRMPSDTILNSAFRYAGVISFAGAIFSTKGLPAYATPPAPTLFFHGSADKMVPYNKVSFFNLGMFGSKQLAKRFKKEQYPFLFYTMENIGHDVATYPMEKHQQKILRFIQEYVFEKKQLMVDINYFDPNQESKFDKTPKDYYK